MSVPDNSPAPGTTPDIKSLLSVIRSLVGEVHPHWKNLHFSPDTHLEKELGLDSMARMELCTRIAIVGLLTWVVMVLAPFESWRRKLAHICARLFFLMTFTPFRVTGQEYLLPSVVHVKLYAARTGSPTGAE